MDESVSFFKQGFAGTGGVEKSARKSGKDSNKIFWGKWEDYKHVLDYGRSIDVITEQNGKIVVTILTH